MAAITKLSQKSGTNYRVTRVVKKLIRIEISTS